MQWRLRYLACRFTQKDNIVIKIRLGMVKSAAEGQTKFLDVAGYVTKDYNKLGKKIDKIFPLMDPGLPFEEAKDKHQAIIENNSGV